MPRPGYITASQFAAAVGVNPYCSRQKCARLMLGLETEESNFATQQGNDKEWLAIANYEAIMGNLVVDQQRWHEWSEGDLKLGCHIDGYVIEANTVVEVKTPKDLDSFDRNYAAPPAYYIPQVQGQMALSGASQAHFVANYDDCTRIWLIESNLVYWGALVSRLDEFWRLVSQGKIPPRSAKPVFPDVKIERIY